MLTIRTFSPKQLFKDEGMCLLAGTHNYCIYMDAEPDLVHKVLTRDDVFVSQKGPRIKVPMILYGVGNNITFHADDSETTGSETKEILICKIPQGYLIGVYLY